MQFSYNNRRVKHFGKFNVSKRSNLHVITPTSLLQNIHARQAAVCVHQNPHTKLLNLTLFQKSETTYGSHFNALQHTL